MTADYDDVRALIEDDIRGIDALIRQRLTSDILLIRQVAEYIISSGGKRLRPAVLVLSARAAGYRGEQHHTLAAVVEFIHTATLLHDDVVDESELRRGRRTANAEFGNAASVLVGDFLYSRAFQMMVQVGDMAVMRVLADATNTIAEGEVLQLMHIHNPDVSVESYLDVVRRKTAKLFEAAGWLGGILADAGPEVETGLARYGMHLGTAFQLIDDALDYAGDEREMGKRVGDDLGEGKATLPLIYVLERGDKGQASLVRRAIEDGGGQHLVQVLAAIRACGALDYTRALAREEAELARASLATLPRSKYREALIDLAAFAVERTF